MLNNFLLAKCMECPQSVADAWFHHLWTAMQSRGISAPRRVGHFLAEIGHESQGLTRGEENMRYRAARLQEMGKANGAKSRWAAAAKQAGRLAGNPESLANFVYASREGNADETSGDGWRYRARGPIGLTFRNNYARMSALTGLDLVNDPDTVSTAAVGAQVACAYWQDAGLNAYADRNDGLSIGRIINIGRADTQRMPNGWEDRSRRTRLVFKIMGIT